MAKLQAADITEADLSQYLSACDDFRFELEIFHASFLHALTAEHGGTYEDPVTSKDRQFDIRAQFARGRNVLKLAIECKNLKTNFPLLVSTVPRRSEEAFHYILRASKLLRSNCLPPEVHEIRPSEFFSRGAPVGKATVQVGRNSSKEFTSGDAEVYEKWAQAIASAHQVVFDSSGAFDLTGGEKALVVVLPVLVIPDDTLWLMDYDAKGSPLAKPRRANACTFYLNKTIESPTRFYYTLSHLMIFTKTGLMRYLERLKKDSDAWEELFPIGVQRRLASEP